LTHLGLAMDIFPAASGGRTERLCNNAGIAPTQVRVGIWVQGSGNV